MEEYTPEQQEAKTEELKRWFQDNLRIIISIAIVIVIAGGIYSYSKRTDSPIVAEQSTEKVDTEEATVEVADETQATTTAATTTTVAKDNKPEVSAAEASKETESSFVETASKGEGLTHLARRATANYLEKNPDSALTKEHKIYIEDYLRKSVGHKGGVHVGTSVEFSKDLVQKAIEKSKTLNENHLKNLQKYSARVSSL